MSPLWAGWTTQYTTAGEGLRRRLENVSRKVFVFGKLAEIRVNIVRINDHRVPRTVCRLKRDTLQQALHHGMQTPGADVFRLLIHLPSHLGDVINLGVNSRSPLPSPLARHTAHQRGIGLSENTDKIIGPQRIQFHPDRQPALQFRNKV